jgi:hypothetical protein
MAELKPLDDDALDHIMRTGRTDMISRLTDEEAIRMQRMINRYNAAPPDHTRPDSKQAVEQLSMGYPMATGEVPQDGPETMAHRPMGRVLGKARQRADAMQQAAGVPHNLGLSLGGAIELGGMVKRTYDKAYVRFTDLVTDLMSDDDEVFGRLQEEASLKAKLGIPLDQPLPEMMSAREPTKRQAATQFAAVHFGPELERDIMRAVGTGIRKSVEFWHPQEGVDERRVAKDLVLNLVKAFAVEYPKSLETTAFEADIQIDDAPMDLVFNAAEVASLGAAKLALPFRLRAALLTGGAVAGGVVGGEPGEFSKMGALGGAIPGVVGGTLAQGKRVAAGAKQAAKAPAKGKAEEVIEVVVEQASKSDQLAAGASQALQRHANGMSDVINDFRAAGLDEAAERMTALQRKADEASQALAARGGRSMGEELDKLRQNANRELRTLDEPVKEALENTGTINNGSAEAGIVRGEVLKRLAASQLGAAIGAYVGANEEGTWSLPGAFVGGMMGFLMTDPRIGAWTRKAGQKVSDTDWEEFILGPLEDAMDRAGWDRTINIGKSLDVISTTAGAAIPGAVAGLGTREAGAPLPVSIAAALGAGAVGAVAGKRIAQGLALDTSQGWLINPKTTLQKLFREGGALTPELRKLRGDLLRQEGGLITRIMDTSRELAKANRIEQEVIHEFMRGETSIASVAPRFQNAAADARYLFDELAIKIVEVGLAEGKLAEKILTNVGTYLPRLFLRFEGEDFVSNLGRWAKANNLDLYRIGEKDYLKKKNPNITPEIAKALGEIKNTAYLLGKRGRATSADVFARQFMNEVAAMPDVTLADDLVKAARKLDPIPKKRAGQTNTDWLRDMAMGMKKKPPKLVDVSEEAREMRFFRTQGPRGPEDYAQFGNKTYRKMPDNDALGPLKGRWVEEGVAAEFDGMIQIASMGRKTVDVATGFFKTAKVTLNPATLMRNIIGQLPLMDFAGVSPFNPRNYMRARHVWNDYRATGPLYKEARSAGLLGGEWYGTEVADMLPKAVADIRNPGSFGASIWEWGMRKGLLKAGEKAAAGMERFHEGSEQMFKLVLYDHARNKLGMGIDEAVSFSKRWAFDYRQVPRWIQISRRSPFGAPFISFSYKAMPRIMETALALGDPWKFFSFWKYPLAFSAINEGSAHTMGIVPEGDRNPISIAKRVALNGLRMGVGAGPRWESDYAFQRFLPDHVGNQQLLVPWRDRYSRYQYMDLTYLLPWGDLGEIGKGQIGGNLAAAGFPYFPRQLEPSNPALQLTVAGLTGKDTFTGRNIIEPGSSNIEALTDIGRFVTRSYLPTLTPGIGFSAEKIRKSAFGEHVSDPSVPTPVPAFVSEIAGLRTRGFDSRTMINYSIKKDERELKEVRRFRRKQEAKGAAEFVIENRKKREKFLEERIRKNKILLGKAPPTSPELREAKQKLKRKGGK